ncbi:MAG: 4-hydroxy-3-methylbut-2-enyl diphosphate reductase [Actinobacteria bacterium]|nr:4-hydroxy-3-methylbut-2-enyl diphosphate reductase [Actinomycetota bacterium]MCL5887630.1 4-hydroxy-3-methylbut-2-enyl diphosphate reductase [Actinomycetota bacterium]
MKVRVARHAGVCYGVERALKLAEEAACASTAVHTLGPLIHNPQAVSELREAGIVAAESLDEVGEGVLIIRSHGVDPAIIDSARAKGLTVIDATCPHVSKVHQAASVLRDEGYHVVIVGEADHPEVEGIMAHAGGEALVLQSEAELPSHIPAGKVGVVVQTTQSHKSLTAVVDALVPRSREIRVFNTICSATAKRQRSAEKLAADVDVVIVVGGYNSGNTARLTEVSKAVNPRTWQVETADEVDESWFTGATIVGVTAGASTPDKQMREVIAAIEAIGTSM